MQKDEEMIIKNMKEYAETKYGQEFEVQTFRSAKDSTYRDVLTLVDGEYLFNVYHSGEDKDFSNLSDDFSQEIIDEKFEKYFQEELEDYLQDAEIYPRVMLTSEENISYEEVKKLSVDQMLERYNLLKVVIVIKVETDIQDHETSLFNIYKSIVKLEPSHIDFEVIQVQEQNDKLDEMLKNLRLNYENDWSSYTSVVSSLSVMNKDIKNVTELMKGVK